MSLKFEPPLYKVYEVSRSSVSIPSLEMKPPAPVVMNPARKDHGAPPQSLCPKPTRGDDVLQEEALLGASREVLS